MNELTQIVIAHKRPAQLKPDKIRELKRGIEQKKIPPHPRVYV